MWSSPWFYRAATPLALSDTNKTWANKKVFSQTENQYIIVKSNFPFPRCEGMLPAGLPVHSEQNHSGRRNSSKICEEIPNDFLRASLTPWGAVSISAGESRNPLWGHRWCAKIDPTWLPNYTTKKSGCQPSTDFFITDQHRYQSSVSSALICVSVVYLAAFLNPAALA